MLSQLIGNIFSTAILGSPFNWKAIEHDLKYSTVHMDWKYIRNYLMAIFGNDVQNTVLVGSNGSGKTLLIQELVQSRSNKKLPTIYLTLKPESNPVAFFSGSVQFSHKTAGKYSSIFKSEDGMQFVCSVDMLADLNAEKDLVNIKEFILKAMDSLSGFKDKPVMLIIDEAHLLFNGHASWFDAVYKKARGFSTSVVSSISWIPDQPQEKDQLAMILSESDDLFMLNTRQEDAFKAINFFTNFKATDSLCRMPSELAIGDGLLIRKSVYSRS